MAARIFKFSYYLIPQGLSGEALLAEAAAIHKLEPDAQLILVDDESRVKDYIAHAKAVTEGRTDVELPQAWADQHVIANLQKMMSGKWMLYKGYGYEELGEVKWLARRADEAKRTPVLVAGAMPPGDVNQGDGPAREAYFRTFRSMCFSPDGTLYINDASHVIRKLTPAGQVTTWAF